MVKTEVYEMGFYNFTNVFEQCSKYFESADSKKVREA